MDDYVKADSGLVQEFKPVISFFIDKIKKTQDNIEWS